MSGPSSRAERLRRMQQLGFVGLLVLHSGHIGFALTFANSSKRVPGNIIPSGVLAAMLLCIGAWAFMRLRSCGRKGLAIGVSVCCVIGLLGTYPMLLAHVTQSPWWILAILDAVYLIWGVWTLWLLSCTAPTEDEDPVQ